MPEPSVYETAQRFNENFNGKTTNPRHAKFRHAARRNRRFAALCFPSVRYSQTQAHEVARNRAMGTYKYRTCAAVTICSHKQSEMTATTTCSTRKLQHGDAARQKRGGLKDTPHKIAR